MSIENTVNTTNIVPTTSWNTDGPNTGFYCTTEDVISLCIGADLVLLDNMIRVGDIPGMNYTDLLDWITRKLIPDAESYAENKMNRTMRPTQITKMLDGSGGNTLILPHRPVISVQNCQITSTPAMNFYTFTRIRYTENLGQVPPSYYADADLYVETSTGRIQIPPRVLYNDQFVTPNWNYTFIPGQGNIRVSWIYGYSSSSDVEASIRNAVAMLAAIQVLYAVGRAALGGMSEVKYSSSSRMAGRNMNLPYSDLINAYQKTADIELRRKRKIAI